MNKIIYILSILTSLAFTTAFAAGTEINTHIKSTSTDTPGLFVGYLDLSAGNNPSIMDGVNHGYNVVIVGWGYVNGDNVSIWPSTLSNDPNLATDITSAHAKGAKVFLTFGGANNTFIPPANATVQDAQTIANGMIALVNTYGFDGLDFDLENTDVAYNFAFMQALLQDLKTAKPDLLLSGAPQINGQIYQGWNYMGFAPIANGPSWNQLINTDLFDYIFVQAYNQGYGANIVSNMGPSTDLMDADPGFLAASYEALLSGYLPNYPNAGSPNNDYNAPAGWDKVAFNQLHTQVILGVPSVLGDWRGANEGVADPALIKAQWNCLETGTGCTQYQPSTTYKPAGLMTWSIAGDQYVNWSFSAGLSACIVNGQCQ